MKLTRLGDGATLELKPVAASLYRVVGSSTPPAERPSRWLPEELLAGYAYLGRDLKSWQQGMIQTTQLAARRVNVERRAQ